MKTIYKYEVPSNREHAVVMPANSRIVHVGEQNGGLMLWVEHAAFLQDQPHTVTRRFDVFGTGGIIPDSSVYVGTFFDGPFVWHVYETEVPS